MWSEANLARLERWPRKRCRLFVVFLVATGCIVVTRAPPPSQAPSPPDVSSAGSADIDWTSGELVPYRLVTKDDFRASSSNSLWGNVAHGAEICTTIVYSGDSEAEVSFQALMRPECSFWNKVIGPAGTIIRMAGAIAGVPTITPEKQPDWYILQHEQIHFAINEVAARQASQQIAKFSPERRGDLAPRLHELILEKAQNRHTEFDGETSGKFDPDNLEKWVRVLQVQMSRLCGSEPHCEVRTPD